MALAAACVFEVRPGAGSDSNGGGFKLGATGTDYSQQNAAQATLTTASVVHTTTTQINVSVGDHTVSANDVGNIFQLTSGTATADFYEITVVDVPNNRWTVDKAVGTAGQTCAGAMGGALASIGKAGDPTLVAGNRIWVKSGTDTLTTSSSNVSGGIFVGSATGLGVFGYSTTRGDLTNSIGSASRPVINAGSVTSVTMIGRASDAGRSNVANIVCNGNSGASVVGFSNSSFLNCTATLCVTGFSSSGSHTHCSATSCGTGFSGFNTVSHCFTNDCTTAGFAGSVNTASVIDCISINDAIACTNNGDGLLILNSTFHEPSGDSVSGASICARIVNSLFTSATGDAIDFSNATTAPTTAQIVNCAFRGNGAIYETTPPTTQTVGSITLTGDPYTNEATDDLSPNNTAGAGADIRNAGIDVYGQTDNHDVGAVQHADPAGGGGLLTHPGMTGGIRG